jgi:hypothetical protein
MREDYDDEFWEAHSVERPRGKCVDTVREFEELLDREPNEAEVQKALEAQPWILAEQHPHCHFVLPQFSLSGMYVTDFVLPERSSAGTFWYLVEIEKPKAKLVTRDGQLAKTVRIAVQQVKDWKTWLLNNQDVAARQRSKGGLGLHDISRMVLGTVIVGRRSDVTERFNELREQEWAGSQIKIMTYDRLIDCARQRAEHWDNYDKSIDKMLSGGNAPFSPPPLPKKSDDT